MTTRRSLLVTMGAGLLALSGAAWAQQKEKVWRVGVLSRRARPDPSVTDYTGEFLRAMRERGYVEGKNLMVEWRSVDEKVERLPRMAADLVELAVDVIVTDAAGAIAAQKATRTIPIVFSSQGDPVALGLVKSLARPEGNSTGVTYLSEEAGIKSLEMLRSLVPGVTFIGLLLNPGAPNSRTAPEMLRAAAAIMKVRLLPLEVRNEEELERAFAAMRKEGVGAFMLIPDGLWTRLRDRLVQMELKHRLPGYGFPRFGGLFYYGQNLWDVERFKAAYVDKILKGAKPSDLPVEQSTKMELVINRKTARALGLTISPELLLLADRIID